MTIITKTGASEKKENEQNLKKEAAVDVPIGGEKPPPRSPSIAWGEGGNAELLYYRDWRRRRLLTSLCVALLILWLMLAAILGGILLFRHLHRRPVFYGWCGTKYTERDMRGHPHYERLQERVEVDPDSEYEKIEVPRFGPNRPAVFIHDFKQNLSAIVDLVGEKCFLKNLDRTRIAPPTSFIDLVKKMEEGYYEQNSGTLQERYRVRYPPLSATDVEDLNSYMISAQCHDKVTFMMDPISDPMTGRLQLFSSREVMPDSKNRKRRSLRRRKRETCQSFSWVNPNGGKVETSVICS